MVKDIKEDIQAIGEWIVELDKKVKNLEELRNKLTQCLRHEHYPDFQKCALKATGWED